MLAPSPPAPLSQNPRTYYDVCFSLPGQSSFRTLDSGVTLNKDIIAWTQDERTTEISLGNIVAVHLSSGGRRVIVDRCAITFSDNNVLTVVNSDGAGYYDSEHAKSYRAFVQDLHARLASGPFGAIRFTAGWTQSRYLRTLVLAAVGAIAAVVIGVWALLALRSFKGLLIVIFGCIGAFRLERMTRANAPRAYTPDKLPTELMT
jgi:hypothetical protein